MQIIVTESYDEMSARAFDEISGLVQANPACVLGLATGTTPIGIYERLVGACASGALSFAHVTTFNLDEYCGLAPADKQSYRFFMDTHLFNHVDIDKGRTHVPAGDGVSDNTCTDYERMIKEAGGIDLQLLGLGHNGHIGFNEPCEFFPKETHEVSLAESTIQANSRLFDSIDDVPRSAITMGIGTIMAARKVVVVANGAGKAAIVKRAFTGPVTPEVPASILQFHPDAVVIVDAAAAAELAL